MKDFIPTADADSARAEQEKEAIVSQLRVLRGAIEKERLRAARWHQAIEDLHQEAEVSVGGMQCLLFLLLNNSRQKNGTKGNSACSEVSLSRLVFVLFGEVFFFINTSHTSRQHAHEVTVDTNDLAQAADHYWRLYSDLQSADNLDEQIAQVQQAILDVEKDVTMDESE